MTFSGHVANGVIVLEGQPVLPEGAAVMVEVLPTETAAPVPDQTLGQKLLKHAGKVVGLPADASRNHDHYLYGTPKGIDRGVSVRICLWRRDREKRAGRGRT